MTLNFMRLLLAFGFSILASFSFGRTYMLEGKIVDTQGDPLIAANVLIKGTSTGTLTDFNGDSPLNINLQKGSTKC